MSHSFSKKIAGIALIGFIAVSGLAAVKGPKIVFKAEKWDFGKIKQGAEPSYEFVFTNGGDAVLNILNVETSCGCTAILVSNKKVDPGKTGKIKVTFNSTGYAGEVAKYIYVQSDDPTTPRAELKIEAAVDVPPQPKIDLDRYSYDAGLLVEGENLETDVTVKNRGELELRFECALPGATFLLNGTPAVFPIKVAAGKDVLVKVVFPAAGRVGFLREFALFKTNDPLRSTISLTLSGYLVTKDQLKRIFEKYKTIIK